VQLWITSLWLSFVSFIASFYFFKLVARFFWWIDIGGPVAFLFFPSVVSGIGSILRRASASRADGAVGRVPEGYDEGAPCMMEFVLAAVSIWFVWNLKYYGFLSSLPIVCTSLVVQAVSIKLKNSLPAEAIPLGHPIFYSFACVASSFIQLSSYADPSGGDENNQAFVSHSDSGDVIHLEASTLPGEASSGIHHWRYCRVIQTFFVEADTLLNRCAWK